MDTEIICQIQETNRLLKKLLEEQKETNAKLKRLSEKVEYLDNYCGDCGDF